MDRILGIVAWVLMYIAVVKLHGGQEKDAIFFVLWSTGVLILWAGILLGEKKDD